MYKSLIWMAMAASCLSALAAAPPVVKNAPLSIERKLLGSGEQGQQGVEQAQPVGDFGVWHVPQYMPGYPTSATIWPRVITVRCRNQQCEGDSITPDMGPGEYLFFVPSEDSSGSRLLP